MLTIETIAEVDSNGRLTANTSLALPPGPHRVVIVLDEAILPRAASAGWRDLAAFRASLGARPYDGNSIADMRAEERS